MLTAAACVVVVISINLFNCIFCIGICGVGSGSGSNSGYGTTSYRFLIVRKFFFAKFKAVLQVQRHSALKKKTQL